MENIEKYTDFLEKNSEFFSKMSKSAFGKITQIAQWWHRSTDGFCSMSGTGNGGGHYIFTYINSCQYTDHAVELKMKEFNTENQELKSLIFDMLDKISELKKHNKSLSERILSLENKPPIILY